MSKQGRWIIHFEPKENITAYEVALFLKYRYEKGGKIFQEDWENGTVLESLKKHVRIEIVGGD